MKRFNDEHIKDVLASIMKKPKIKCSYFEYKLKSNWAELMSPAIAQMTDSIELKKHKLVLRLNSATLRNEYYQNKDVLMNRLNEFLGESFIREIVLK